MPSIDYTVHAETRMLERHVSREQVEAVVASPEQVLEASQGRTELQGTIDRAGRSMLLRVIVEQRPETTLVITVIATSRGTRYGGGP